MTLDELEESQPIQGEMCDFITKPKDSKESKDVGDDSEDEVDPKLQKVVDKILVHFYGKTANDNKKPAIAVAKKRVLSIISKGLNFEYLLTLEDDLWETLDLLQSSLKTLNRLKQSYPHVMGGPVTNDLIDEIVEHLDQWGLGDEAPPKSLTNPKGITESELAELMGKSRDEPAAQGKG